MIDLGGKRQREGHTQRKRQRDREMILSLDGSALRRMGILLTEILRSRVDMWSSHW